MALCGVAQIFLCFCAPETSRLKRAISLSLVCQRALLHGEGQGSPQTFGKMMHNEEIWANVDLLESTLQAWRGWPGFCRQRAEVGEMPHGCRAASADLRRTRVRPLPVQPPIATAHIACAMCRVCGQHWAWIPTRRGDRSAIYYRWEH